MELVVIAFLQSCLICLLPAWLIAVRQRKVI